MALSAKYGKLYIRKIGEDEPVFILRAQDMLAGAALQMYRALAASHNLELAGDIDKVIEHFRGWSGKRKMPD